MSLTGGRGVLFAYTTGRGRGGERGAIPQDEGGRMRISWKGAVGLVIGGGLLGSVVSGAAQAPTPTPAPAQPGDGWKRGPGGHGPGHGGGPWLAIRSESVLPGIDGGPIRTVRTDRGELKAIDGSTLT